MKTMIELLRDADPLLHEARTTMDQRDSRRKALLAAASIPHDRAGANPRSRATLLVTLGFAMIVVLFLGETSFRFRSHLKRSKLVGR